MSDDNVTQLSQHVQINLDTLERTAKKPFAFSLGDKRIELTDPAEIPFTDLMTIEHPTQFLKFALSDEAKVALAEANLPSWKFNELLESYMKYYDLDPSKGKGWLS